MVSIRGLARRHHVHRRTVRQALAAALLPARKSSSRRAPSLGPHKSVVVAWLSDDLAAPRKQRHTARRNLLSFFTGVCSHTRWWWNILFQAEGATTQGG